MSDNIVRIIAVQQPYVALAVLGIKDIENRSWPTKVRGPVLLYASQTPSGETLADMRRRFGITITPQLVELSQVTGGIIGGVKIIDCLTYSPSKWFTGKYGFVLDQAITLPFVRIRGPQGWLRAKPELLDRYREQLRSWL